MKLVYNDEAHSYWLNGKRAKSASKVAQIASDTFQIEQWKDRQMAIGMTLDRALAERVAVNLDNDKMIQKVCEDAHTAAKSYGRATRGTQRHRVLELLLLGRTDQFITDQQCSDAEVLQRTLDAYQLEPVPDRVEQFVAYPEHGVVGRYDCILGHQGRTVLTDLKGGVNAVRYPHSTLVQGALYRFAPATSAAIVHDGDVYTATEWTTFPTDLDDEVFYVIYCDDHHDVGELWRLDLTHGRVGADLALQIVDWRKRHAEVYAVPDRRTLLLDRYNLLNETQQAAYRALNIPKDDLDAIETGIDKVEPFNIEIPPVQPETPPESVTPPVPPAEGGTVTAADVDALEQRFDKLSDSARAWTSTLVSQSYDGWPWTIRGNQTVRRYELYRGVLTLAEAFDGVEGSDDMVTAIVANVTDTGTAHFTRSPTTTPGVALGMLNSDEAKQFAFHAGLLVDGRFLVIYREDGTPQIQAAA